jgi:tRNA dimethylallyltransferase
MVASGAIEEVERLVERALDPALPVMRAIGVGAIVDYLRGATSLSQAIASIAQDTRRYAKRQRTWARNQFPAEWLRVPILHNTDIDG